MRKLKIEDMKPVYGSWVVVSGPHEGGKWLCRCKRCGREKLVCRGHLRNGSSTACRSCGQRDGLGHRFSHLPEKIYRKIRGAVDNAYIRCNSRMEYVERGIEVRFDNKESFMKYLLTLLGHDNFSLMLDRIDNNGHYEVGNLRFVTAVESARNKRPWRRRKWGNI